MSAPASTKRKLLANLLKVAFIAIVMFYLGKRGFISADATLGAFRRPDVLIPAMTAVVSTALLAAIRWHWLLQAQGMNLPFLRTLELNLVGGFFNIALPGAVSGDVVKAYYIGREVPGRRAHAMGAILFDRICGLSALVLVAAGAVLADYSELAHAPVFVAIRTALILSAAGVIGFYGYLVFVHENHDPLLRLLEAVARRFPRLAPLPRIYEGVRAYHHSRGTMLAALALSIVVHLTICWAFVRFSIALGVEGLPVPPVFLVVPFGLLVTAVPVLPAGVGTGHAAFGWGFLMLGTPRGADLFTLFICTQLFVGMIGGAAYLRFRSQDPAGAAPLPG